MSRRTPRTVDRALALAPLPFAILAAVLVFAVHFAGSAYAYFARDLPPVEDFARDQLPLPTQVFARDGRTLLYEFVEERRELVTLAEVPQTLVDATVSAEDNSFWTNPGVDVVAIVRAGLRYLAPGGGKNPQGASTITQQLVKQRLVGNEVSLDRKVKEAILAVAVTERYSKEAILALYLNEIFYGNQAYGVKAAAHAYFRLDDLGQLTLAQAALLAGLPQSPTLLDPSKGENLGRALARRQYVLEQMRQNGYIDDEEYRRANAEPIAVKTMPPASIRAPHFLFRVKEALAKILGSEGAIERGGYTVITTLDWAKQQEAEKQVKAWVDQLHAKNVFNAALVSIDPKTGEVLAYVGSVDYGNTSDPRVQGEFDAAGIGERQAGSAFKVFNYATALQRGATPATVVVDARTDFGGGYRPENADLQYHGPLTMRQAIRESRNVPAVKFLQQYSGDRRDHRDGAGDGHHRRLREGAGGSLAHAGRGAGEAHRHDERLRRPGERRRPHRAAAPSRRARSQRRGRVPGRPDAAARPQPRGRVAHDGHAQGHDPAFALVHLRELDEHRPARRAQDRHDG